MLALPPATGWELRAEADRAGRTPLFDHVGRRREYADIRDEVGDRYIDELLPHAWEAKYQRCMDAVKRLSDDIACLKPDLLVVIGDDQEELFSSRNNPAVAVSYVDTIKTSRPPINEQPGEAHVFLERLGVDGSSYSGDTDAALHIIEHLIEGHVDLAAVGDMGDNDGFGHAFTWVLGRLLRDNPVPSVPILLNTYYPPNQPKPERCLEIGKILRGACEALPGDRRVVIVASGGLSHFVVNEELDEVVLSAIQDHDADVLSKLSPALLNSGSSEIRNWISMSGASEGLASQWTEYQPAYRTAAGTGCGLAFTILTETVAGGS
jgi:3-O-methylgallate 3,4-dioxygenase